VTRQPDCIPFDGSNQSPKNQRVSSDDLAEFSNSLKIGLHRLESCAVIHEERGRAAVESTLDCDDGSIDRDRLSDLLIDQGDDTAAFRLKHCEEPGMGWVGKCENDPNHKVWQSPFYCEQRICPVCAKRRSASLAAAILKPIIALSEGAPRGYKLRHVVLTTDISLDEDTDQVRNHAKRLRVGIRHIFQAMFKDDKILGGFIGEEFGEEGRKLHYHVLVLSKFIPWKKLSEMWKGWTAGRGWRVHVSLIDDVYKAVAEVSKYCTKPVKVNGESQDIEETLARVHAVIKGRRRVQGFGSFYNMPRPDDDEYDISCPDCGGKVVWHSELSYLLAEENAEHPVADLFLRESNKLGRSPPTYPDSEVSEQLEMFKNPQSEAYQSLIS